jgi:hypothetical protein
MLTRSQVDQYHEDGYLIPEYRLDKRTLDDIKSSHSELIERHPQYVDYCPAILPHDPSFVRFACNDDILDMVAQIIGQDIALWNSSFFAKPARVGSTTPWHQDGEYWPMRPLATCTVWIAVDESTVENGCLRVIPGSHKEKRVRKHVMNDAPGLALQQELPPSEINQDAARDLTLEAGQISLHDVFLVHGSEPNRSPTSRRGMTLRFMPTTSHYDRQIELKLGEDPGQVFERRHPLFLMRGIDQCGRNDFENETPLG